MPPSPKAELFAHIVTSEGFAPHGKALGELGAKDDLDLAGRMAEAWGFDPAYLYSIMRAEGTLRLQGVGARICSVGNALFPTYKENMPRACPRGYAPGNGYAYSDYRCHGISGWIKSTEDARDWFIRHGLRLSDDQEFYRLCETWGGNDKYGQSVENFVASYRNNSKGSDLMPPAPAPETSGNDPIRDAIESILPAVQIALGDKSPEEKSDLISSMALDAAVGVIDELTPFPEPVETISDMILRSLRTVIAGPLARKIEAGLRLALD